MSEPHVIIPTYDRPARLVAVRLGGAVVGLDTLDVAQLANAVGYALGGDR
ncbi:hypothetical protein [Rubrivirga sp.]